MTSLSDKIIKANMNNWNIWVRAFKLSCDIVPVEDVKEFIKKLKEGITKPLKGEAPPTNIYELIDKLAGDDLI